MSQFESTSKHSGEQGYASSQALLMRVDPHTVECESSSFPRPLGETAVLSGLVYPGTQAQDTEHTAPQESIVVAESRSPSKLMSTSYLMRDLREAAEGATETANSLGSRLGMSALAKTLVTASAAIGTAGAFIVEPVVAAGFAAIALWQAGQLYEKNRHTRAISLLASSLYTSHMSAMGFQAAAMCSFAATSRSILQSMVADDRPIARATLAAALFGATAVAYTAMNNQYPSLSIENIPLITLALTSLAGAFNERFSWASRLTILISTSLALGYHAVVTQSSVACWANGMLLPGLLLSIWRYDICRKEQSQR